MSLYFLISCDKNYDTNFIFRAAHRRGRKVDQMLGSHSAEQLTDDKFISFKSVRGELQVERSGTLSNTTTNVVVRSVARAEPTVILSSARNRDTS